MASPELDTVLAHLRFLTGSTARAEGGGVLALRRLSAAYPLVDPACTDLVTTVAPVDADGVAGEWHTTPNADHGRRLLYLHGGGWMGGSLGSHRTLVSHLTAATGGVTLAVDYRLAPEHPFPAGLDDCLTAYGWMAEHGPEDASPAHSVAVAGDSAGGNLAIVTTLLAEERTGRWPDATVALSPLVDLSGDGESHRTRREADPVIPPGTGGMQALADAYTQGHADRDDPRVAPIHAELTGMPPLMIVVGDAEVLLSDSTGFAARAEAAGVDVTLEVWDDMPHIFPVFAPFLPEAVDAIDHIGEFLAKHT